MATPPAAWRLITSLMASTASGAAVTLSSSQYAGMGWESSPPTPLLARRGEQIVPGVDGVYNRCSVRRGARDVKCPAARHGPQPATSFHTQSLRSVVRRCRRVTGTAVGLPCADGARCGSRRLTGACAPTNLATSYLIRSMLSGGTCAALHDPGRPHARRCTRLAVPRRLRTHGDGEC